MTNEEVIWHYNFLKGTWCHVTFLYRLQSVLSWTWTVKTSFVFVLRSLAWSFSEHNFTMFLLIQIKHAVDNWLMIRLLNQWLSHTARDKWVIMFTFSCEFICLFVALAKYILYNWLYFNFNTVCNVFIGCTVLPELISSWTQCSWRRPPQLRP